MEESGFGFHGHFEHGRTTKGRSCKHRGRRIVLGRHEVGLHFYAVLLVFAGFGVIEFVKHSVNVIVLKYKEALKNEAVFENVHARPSNVDGDYFLKDAKDKEVENVAVMNKDQEKRSTAASSTETTRKRTVIKIEALDDGTEMKEPARQVFDEYTRQTGFKTTEKDKNKIPKVSSASQKVGTPEYAEMMTGIVDTRIKKFETSRHNRR